MDIYHTLWIVTAIALVIVGVFVFALSGAPKPRADDGAVIARICRDGSRIWRYTDGTYRSFGSIVEDVEKVCQ